VVFQSDTPKENPIQSQVPCDSHPTRKLASPSQRCLFHPRPARTATTANPADIVTTGVTHPLLMHFRSQSSVAAVGRGRWVGHSGVDWVTRMEVGSLS
jgi:hypothetical protein